MIKIRWKIETITPIHIGTGNTLERWDYYEKDNKIYIIDINKIKIDSRTLYRQIEQQKNIKEVLNYFNISPERVAKYILTKSGIGRRVWGTILEHIKNINNLPYIPGSELKGAIRTAILWKRLRDKGNINDLLNEEKNEIEKEIEKNPQKKKSIIKKWEKKLGEGPEKELGKDPQVDIMKSIYIPDTTAFSENSLRLGMVKVLTVGNNNTIMWKKDFRKKINTYNYREALPIYMEYISEGTSTILEIIIEDKFWELDKENVLKFKDKKDLLLTIEDILREYSTAIIDNEIKFYNDIKFSNMEKFYTSLKKDGHSIYLPIGWGTGHQCKTLFYLLDTSLKKWIRENFRMGKRGVELFPKTRKIVFKDERPISPLGWIKVEMIK